MKPISMGGRKLLLTLHIIFSAIMLGGSVAFFIFSLVAASTHDMSILEACYRAMHLLSDTSMRASTIGTVITGVLLSVWTHWGLFRYYWIVAKELLTLVTIATGLYGMYVLSLRGLTMMHEGVGLVAGAAFETNRLYLMTGIVIQLVSLVAMMALSVYKPWGKRKAAVSAK
ncbi:MAG: hypothetical protein J7639_29950 [Paenibacillaceae bacterium]|nr:hypothetical protein [Paenibacillaceae bacterium]